MHSLIKSKLLGLAFLCLCLMATGVYFSYSLYKEQDLSFQKEGLVSSKKSPLQLFKIPLYFEKNEGQIDASVKYLAKGRGFSFFFTPEEIVMVLKKSLRGESKHSFRVLKLQFVGAKQDPKILGVNEQACKSNYFIGSDSTKWRTDISNFAKVQYEELYPGIDAVFYGNDEQFEYDLCLSPHADAQIARIRIEGAQSLHIDEKGNLCLQLEDGEEVQMKKPIVYQTFSDKQISVNGDYVLMAYNEVGFSLGNYDKAAKLVIDPILVYSSYLGGSDDDIGNGIAVDSAGNAYVTGGTSSTNFPTKNPFQSSNAGIENVFISKFNPALSGAASLIYSTYLGGSGIDIGNGIAVDSAGNAYVTGETSSTNFPTLRAFQTAYGGGVLDVFVTVLNSDGNGLIYSTYLGGGNTDRGFGIDVDSTGNAYVAGQTSSTNFPTKNPFQSTLSGTQDAFVAKIDPAFSGTSSLIYSSYLGGTNVDSGLGIAVDTGDNAYVTGFTQSTDFPTVNAFQTTLAGTQNAFVTKIDSIPSLVYSSYLGGNVLDTGFDIAVDSSGNAYVTGSTNSTNFPTVNALKTTLSGPLDAFVTKINSIPSLVYSSYLGGSAIDSGLGIAVDFSGNAYVTGRTQSTNFPTLNAFKTTLSGGQDAFVTKIDPTASGTASLVYSSYLGGSAFDSGLGIAVDAAANAYITGSTASTNFPTINAFQTSFGGGALDAFIVKVSNLTVSEIFPSCGPTSGGTNVIITGTNLTGVTDVHFGAIAASSFFVMDDNHIVAVSPPQGQGIVDVTVSISGFTSSPTPLDEFTYVLPPSVNGLNPSSGCQPEGTSIIITGSGFTGATDVKFGSTSTSFTFNSDSQITAIIPPGTGTVHVTVTTLCGGTSAISAVDQFTYRQNTSIILNAPKNAPRGQLVTLTASVSPSSVTGSVSFLDGTILIGTAPLVNDMATLQTTFTSTGEHLLTATYSGDILHCPSISATVILTVLTTQPPTHLEGIQRINEFATQKDLINFLSWRAPKRGTPIAFFKIYRDKNLKKLIAKIPNHNQPHFVEHNRREGKTYIYYIVSIDEFGNVSSPAKIIVHPRKEN